MRNKSVLIVGAGPVGMILAARLEHYGVQTKIIDRQDMVTEGSKGLSVNSASLKVFESMGIIDQFLKKGNKVHHINLHWYDQRLAHLDYKHLENSPHKYFLTLPQPDSESIFVNHLSNLGREVDRHVSLENICQLEEGVEVDLFSEKKGRTTETFDYVVGCDGSRSTVRELMGFDFSGHDYNMYFILFDARLDWEGLGDQTHYYVKEDGFVLIIPLTDGRHRIVIKDNLSSIDEARKKRTLEEYQAYVNRLGPGGIRIKELLWTSSAPFYNRLSEKYREKRVFLAGDAAHLFSPIGGLGMNTGIQDAFNLAWKLAGVVKGQYSDSILNTYEMERREMAKFLNAGIDKNTLMITRRDTDVNGNLQQWLPNMENRDFFRKTWPLNFSGLGHKYSHDVLAKPYMKGRVMSGAHVPYGVGVNKEGKAVSTYQLTDVFKPALLFFIDQYSEREAEALARLKQYGFQVFLVFKAGQLIADIGLHDYLLVGDEFCQCLEAGVGDIIALRPDGYVGGVGNIEQLTDYCLYLDSFKSFQVADNKVCASADLFLKTVI